MGLCFNATKCDEQAWKDTHNTNDPALVERYGKSNFINLQAMCAILHSGASPLTVYNVPTVIAYYTQQCEKFAREDNVEFDAMSEIEFQQVVNTIRAFVGIDVYYDR